MASKILLDANILIEFLLERNNFQLSQRLLKGLIDSPHKLFVTPSIIHITSYWVKKSLGTETTKTLLLELLADIKTIDCDHKTVVLAINSAMTDIEDALQYYTALQHRLEYNYFRSAFSKASHSNFTHLFTTRIFDNFYRLII